MLRPISLSEAVSSTQPSTIASGSQFALESCAVSGRGTFTRSSLPSSTPSSLLKTTTPRDGARNLPGGPTGKAVISDIEITSDQPQTDTFVAADLSEEQWFLIDVLGAVKRWFSCHGWPGRYHPVDIPDSLRSSLTCDGVHQPSKGDEAVRAGRWRPASRCVKSDVRHEANNKSYVITVRNLFGLSLTVLLISVVLPYLGYRSTHHCLQIQLNEPNMSIGFTQLSLPFSSE